MESAPDKLKATIVELPVTVEVPAGPEEAAKPKYPIVKMDRQTLHGLLPAMMNKGIFTNATQLPTRTDILEQERKRLNLRSADDLDKKQIRQALTGKEYRDGEYIFRDYGDNAVGFSSRLYIDYIKQTEEDLRQELLSPHLFPDMDKNIRGALEKIRLYKLGHSIALTLLSQVFVQKKFKGLVIMKQELLASLGKDTEDKQIYQDIKDSILSLRWLNFKFFEYGPQGNKGDIPSTVKAKTTGNFIYNVREDHKSFTLDINPTFVGCVQYFSDETLSKAEKREKFKSGYIGFPTSMIPFTADDDPNVYALTIRLGTERGNPKLNEKETEFKVVAAKVHNFITWAGIKHDRQDRRYSQFVKTLQKVRIIEKMEPGVTHLENLTPAKGMETTLKVWIRSPDTRLDEFMQAKLSGGSQNGKK